jgi:hypothetical protein
VSNDPDAFVFRTSKGTAWIGDDLVIMDSPAVNAPLKVRQDRIGHSDEEMTFLYTHAEGAEHQAGGGETRRAAGSRRNPGGDGTGQPQGHVKLPHNSRTL